MMYKLYSHSTEQYIGNDLSRSIPISLFSTLPSGTPDWVIPSEFEEETLEKVQMLPSRQDTNIHRLYPLSKKQN
jgi:hypothetical protein